MEAKIKKTIKAGNSSAVILPRSWLNKEVRVELIKKTPEIILSDIISIVKKYIELGDIIGVYLIGSYARGEEDENSDIDILVITLDTDKEMINEGIYNILMISSELLKQKLNQDLFPVGQMIREAKPILNSSYLDSMEIKITNRNIKWYLDTTEDKLKIISRVIDKMRKNNKKCVNNVIAYTLVLRIRTLYILKKLMENLDYSKRDFIRLIKKISEGITAYEGYLAVKNNSEEKSCATIEETEKLYNYLKSELIEVKKLKIKNIKDNLN